MIVYKAQNLYTNWTLGGPDGTVYGYNKSGWFNSTLFEQWFFKLFLPRIKYRPGKKIVLGDNLASHFNSNVVREAKKHQIFFIMLPPNSTHLTQHLDVSVFGPMKRTWRDVLTCWKRETKVNGPFPKEIFPALLNRLTIKMETVHSNLISGFRSCGLHPLDRSEVMKKLPQLPTGNAAAILNEVVIDMLKENRQKEKSVKRTGGQKLCETPSGAALQANNDDANPFKDLNDPTGFDTACGSVLELNEDDPFIDIINDQMDIATENTADESSDYEDFQVDLDICYMQ